MLGKALVKEIRGCNVKKAIGRHMAKSVDAFLDSLEADHCKQLRALEPGDSAVDKTIESKWVRHKLYVC